MSLDCSVLELNQCLMINENIAAPSSHPDLRGSADWVAFGPCPHL